MNCWCSLDCLFMSLLYQFLIYGNFLYNKVQRIIFSVNSYIDFFPHIIQFWGKKSKYWNGVESILPSTGLVWSGLVVVSAAAVVVVGAVEVVGSPTSVINTSA